jgi:hypothetical protein
MSAYRDAINGTTSLVEQRARYFRNHVVVVALSSVAAIVWALGTSSFIPLAVLLFLLPVSAAFFVADSKLLGRWREELLAAWSRMEIDFAAFSDAIRANPVLPRETTEGMLLTLPSAGLLTAEQKLLPPTRHALAAANIAVHRERADSLLLKAAASAIVIGILLAAIWTSSWTPLSGLAVLVLWPALAAGMRRRRRLRWDLEVDACRKEAGFSEADYSRLLANQGVGA